jgi:hypothetical protein
MSSDPLSTQLPRSAARAHPILAALAQVALAGALVGCNQDPFGLSKRELSGQYALEQFEVYWYYVVDPQHELEEGGTFGGVAIRVGVRDSLIAAQVVRRFGGDTVYALVNTHTGNVAIPLTARSLATLSGGEAIPLVRADSAWKSR